MSPISSDHAYGSHASHFVRVWRLPKTSACPQLAVKPVVFVVHGGFWKQKYGLDTASGSGCSTVAPALVRRGLVAVEVEYRRGDDFPHPAPIDDVADAVRYCLEDKNLGLDAALVTLLGFSAGGQLVLQAALQLSPGFKPQSVVAVAPVADLALAARLRLSDGGDAVERAFSGVGMREGCPTCCAESLAALCDSGCQIAVVAGLDDVDVPLEIVDSFRSELQKFANPESKLCFVNIPDANHYNLMDADHACWEEIYSQIQHKRVN